MSIVELVNNGTPVPPAPLLASGPKMPKRIRWVDLPTHDSSGEEAYPGFKARLWVNFPASLLQEIRSGEHLRVKAALSKIVLEHNGWCDEEGEPFPPAGDDTFWEAVPTELATIVIVMIQTESIKLPNSMMQERQR